MDSLEEKTPKSPQGIAGEHQRHTLSKCLVKGDGKANFNHVTFDVGVHTIYSFNKALKKMTEQTFPIYFIEAKALHSL